MGSTVALCELVPGGLVSLDCCLLHNINSDMSFACAGPQRGTARRARQPALLFCAIYFWTGMSFCLYYKPLEVVRNTMPFWGECFSRVISVLSSHTDIDPDVHPDQAPFWSLIHTRNLRFTWLQWKELSTRWMLLPVKTKPTIIKNDSQ